MTNNLRQTNHTVSAKDFFKIIDINQEIADYLKLFFSEKETEIKLRLVDSISQCFNKEMMDLLPILISLSFGKRPDSLFLKIHENFIVNTKLLHPQCYRSFNLNLIHNEV